MLFEKPGVSPCPEKVRDITCLWEKSSLYFLFSPKPQLLGVKHVKARAFKMKISKTMDPELPYSNP
jgi:hypothetical protein